MSITKEQRKEIFNYCIAKQYTQTPSKKGNIYLCFQGVGKTTLSTTTPHFIDLESSGFKYDDGLRPENWQELYCKTALNLIESGNNVFLATHGETRKWLNDHDIPYYIVFPSLELKDKWIEKLLNRYNEDPSPKNKIAYEQARDNYEKFITNLMEEQKAGKIIIKEEHYSLIWLLESEGNLDYFRLK